MYFRAIDIGIHPREFWSLSLTEVNDLLESHERQQQKQLKSKVIEQCRLAYIVVTDFANSMNQTGKVTNPWDVLPELFTEEKESYERSREEAEFEEYKLRRKAYAQAVNAKRREV